MTIQPASERAERGSPTRRRVIPAIGRAARSGSPDEPRAGAAGRGRRIGLVGGVIGSGVWSGPAKHPREGS